MTSLTANRVVSLAVLLTTIAVPLVAQDRIGIAFVANQGQWPAELAYGTRAQGARAWFGSAGWTIDLAKGDGGVHPLRMTFEGARDALPQGVAQLPTRYHFLVGEQSNWHVDVPAYRSLRFAAIYDGIDVEVRDGGGWLEYDLCLDAGADPRSVVVKVDGADELRVDDEGSLWASTPVGWLRQPPPVTWQVLANGNRRDLPCRYVVLGADRFGFVVEPAIAGARVVIDPGLLWSTFLGAGVEDEVRAVALTAAGDAVVAGRTSSSLFPVTAQALQTTYGGGVAAGGDAFVAQLAADGKSLAWCTFLGGSKDDAAYDVHVGSAGTIAVAGQTASTNFPTTSNALSRTLRVVDAFAVRLSATGSSLLYGTYFGSGGIDEGKCVYLDEVANRLYLAGVVTGVFATTATAYQSSLRGTSDGYLVLIDLVSSPTSMAYATYFGGSLNEDQINDMHVASTGIVTMVGVSQSGDFPTTANGFQLLPRSRSDGCLICLQPANAGAAGLAYGTYWGGGGDGDMPMATHLSAAGILTIAGRTDSRDMAMSFSTAPYQRNHGGGTDDAFVSRLDTSLSGISGLVYATYLGGSGDDGIAAAVVSPTSNVLTLAGSTKSTDFPLTALAFQTRSRGGEEGFLARLDSSLAGTPGLLHSTLLGGCPGDDRVLGLAVDSQGLATAGGYTKSTGFPSTLGPAQPSYGGGSVDGFVTRLDLQPYPTPASSTVGSGCPGTIGAPSVMTVVDDAVLCLPYTVRVTNLRTLQIGSMLLGLSKTTWGSIPLPYDLTSIGMTGCKLWISVDVALFMPYAGNSVTFGFTMPSDASLVGASLYSQFVSGDVGANSIGLVISSAVESVIRL